MNEPRAVRQSSRFRAPVLFVSAFLSIGPFRVPVEQGLDVEALCIFPCFVVWMWVVLAWLFTEDLLTNRPLPELRPTVVLLLRFTIL